MHSSSPPSFATASAVANQVPPLVTKQPELTLEEKIKKAKEKLKKQQQYLDALYHHQQQQTQQ